MLLPSGLDAPSSRFSAARPSNIFVGFRARLFAAALAALFRRFAGIVFFLPAFARLRSEKVVLLLAASLLA